jgi:hypothetical protein
MILNTKIMTQRYDGDTLKLCEFETEFGNILECLSGA